MVGYHLVNEDWWTHVLKLRTSQLCRSKKSENFLTLRKRRTIRSSSASVQFHRAPVKNPSGFSLVLKGLLFVTKTHNGYKLHLIFHPPSLFLSFAILSFVILSFVNDEEAPPRHPKRIAEVRRRIFHWRSDGLAVRTSYADHLAE